MNQKTEIEWLICAATQFELETFRCDGENWEGLTENGVVVQGRVACVVTGVGIPETYFRLQNVLQTLRPLRIVNTGIAGAYPNSGLAIGDIVMGDAETWGDIGFELPEEPGFQSLTDSPFGAFYARKLPLVPLPELRTDGILFGTGCTVSTCTGTEQTGLRRERLFAAHFETMEGAAVAQIGAAAGIAVCEVRAISNIAAQRDMRPENIRDALANLRRYGQACRKKENF